MSPQSTAKNKQAKQRSVPAPISDPNQVQKSGTQEAKTPAPDYSGMHEAIEQISDPVSFESLKAFYGIK